MHAEDFVIGMVFLWGWVARGTENQMWRQNYIYEKYIQILTASS